MTFIRSSASNIRSSLRVAHGDASTDEIQINSVTQEESKAALPRQLAAKLKETFRRMAIALIDYTILPFTDQSRKIHIYCAFTIIVASGELFLFLSFLIVLINVFIFSIMTCLCK
jgi:hypothetical protein